ncbi:GNAT family N-acetyltransferase [Polaromonas sp. SM01]|uniref:GNAT family N-acetyltransferase n=1 Tax=Polaromonas sp. SM01 TaxID=3085630 RepID=UPI002981E9C4|nr:GNAT family N-acetyltransferase [Polaromonas sp. SM01]MDW5444241.1 GNAT family N-acetyltransferase [Polaromonas sp. SM01]
MKNNANDYVIRVLDSPRQVDAAAWNTLLAAQDPASGLNPFMRHEYLSAMLESGSATPKTGWTARFVILSQGDEMVAACALYLKDHSYGEYVFDHAWANAYHQHGLPYYPKALVAPPFTPVPGARLLARDAETRTLLVKALVAWCSDEKLSSLHLLFASDEDVAACEAAGLMLRHNIQFHWTGPPSGYRDFDDFLMSLSQEKRKKIRQERRKVSDAGVSFRWSLGQDISTADWDFFYRCYERTYYEHGNAPYLSRDFFQRMQDDMPENWLLFVAERDGTPIATSLIAVSARTMAPTLPTACGSLPPEGAELARGGPSLRSPRAAGQFDAKNPSKIAYGRYWGALERVDCLHFEACYYQPLQWCIQHGYQRFEGGAQGEHKMARALLPVKTTSAHWLAHPAFADAVERFLEREGEGIAGYMEELERRNPFKQDYSK